MNSRLGRTIISSLLVLVSLCAAQDKEFVVRYLSAEHVYLNGGSADGLSVGQHLYFHRDNTCTSNLEVVFVSEHSASCVMLSNSCAIAVGDRVTLAAEMTIDTVPAPIDTLAKPRSVDTVVTIAHLAKSFAKPQPPKVSGSVAIMAYSWNDRSTSNLDFVQVTTRFNLKVRQLFSRNITLNVRTRGRYDQRARAFDSQVERDTWGNRIWELSLTSDDPSAATSFSAGRILPKRVVSAGYLDGLLIERKVGTKTLVGLMAGADPRWAFDVGSASLQKAGGYFSFIAGEPGASYLEQTVAGIGEYHSGTVSRELIALQGRFNRASTWGTYHTIEFDINRGWRKDKAGKTFALSNVYLGTWCRLTTRIRATVSYDNRTSYWTYETKSTVDSLFDDHLRQGVRSQLDFTLPAQFQSSVSYGLRKRAGDNSPTTSYSVILFKSHLWRSTARASAQYSSFDGPQEHGYNYSARLSDYLKNSILMGIGYGGYSYQADADIFHRTNNWYEISGQADLGRRYFLGASAQINKGDDIDGLQFQSEIGCRF